MTFSDGDSILKTPISCDVENGFVTKIEGGSEAQRLLQTITEAEDRAVSYEREGKLPQGQGEIYKKNARNIGELGIGLNPNALITGGFGLRGMESRIAIVGGNFRVRWDEDGTEIRLEIPVA